MSYVIIHSEVRSGNRVGRLFLSVSVSHFSPSIPGSGGMCRDWWKITPNCFRELSIHDEGNWSFLLLCILHLGPKQGRSLLSLTIKWWLILAYISIQLQYPVDFDAIDSRQNKIDMFWFLMVNYDNSPVRMKLDNLFIYQSVTYRLFGECHALMALESFLYLSKFCW